MTVTSNAGGSGQAGVDLYFVNGGIPWASSSLPWAEFQDLYRESGASVGDVVAALAYEFLVLGYRLLDPPRHAVELIFSRRADLQRDKTLVESCDAIAGAPPPGVLQQGTSRLGWTDTIFNEQVCPGDWFMATDTDCWDNDVGDASDELSRGAVGLTRYVENLGFVFIGFEEVTHSGFRVDKTTTRANGDVVLSGAAVIDGSFSFYLDLPPP